MKRKNKTRSDIPIAHGDVYLGEMALVINNLHLPEKRALVEQLFSIPERAIDIMEMLIKIHCTTSNDCKLCVGQTRWWVIYEIIHSHSLLSPGISEQLFISALMRLGLWKGKRKDFRSLNSYFRSRPYTEWGEETDKYKISKEKVLSYYNMAMLVKNSIEPFVVVSDNRDQRHDEKINLSDDDESIFVDFPIKNSKKIK